ncbi:NAD(P)H-hydrate dehydratase [Pedobacter sp. L105]|uniref:NAD(P)H-hydrate dehydratase n=1 Tax=Pedobacter sp. L105 TaxID=1641871 RepID=UPI00131B1F2C|nr:NAD(P)H-hydrate dehydratase [Pedobacter sp. L105]
MQNLLTSEQMRSTDAFTIKNKGITSIALMESASIAFAKAFMEEVKDKTTAIAVLSGKGNNGADGLAIARLLKDAGYQQVSVYLILFSSRETEEYRINLNLLKSSGLKPIDINSPGQLSTLKDEVIIDAVLGSGLNKALEGSYRELAELVNALNRKVIAVDVPTGFPTEGIINEDNVYLKADLVICFQRPKINFFFPESAAALTRFQVVEIGLDEEFIQGLDSPYQLIDASAITDLIKPRKSFSHKGTYGHALIVAGQEDTMGAALLASRACLHGGAGLTTVSIPESGLTALNAALPEVMYISRNKLAELKKFSAVAVGPGLGTADESVNLLQHLLQFKVPLIIDADALNILAKYQELLQQVTEGSVLTPHMKEFDHLFGTHSSWWERLQTARKKAVEIKCVIILKNQYTFTIDQNGKVTINSTGNPAMAQGGMGDTLTGLVSSFLAQHYTAHQAAYIACYLHGKAGDELAIERVSVTASQLGDQIPVTLKGLIK